jgi:hypothetical protein
MGRGSGLLDHKPLLKSNGEPPIVDSGPKWNHGDAFGMLLGGATLPPRSTEAYFQ